MMEHVGKGGFSNVYRAKDIYSGTVYAIKQYVTSDPANQKTLLEGMESELNVLKHCTHPVLPKIFNIIKENDDFFLVMEYVDGIDLYKYVKQNGVLSPKKLKSIMMQVCSGLYYLHSLNPPIIYRDLKPSNIILKKDGTVKLIDFGIAKRYSRDVFWTGPAYGSRGFAAPEQYGDKMGKSLFNTDIRTDIYSLGTTMYFLRTGKIFTGSCKSWRLSYRLKKIIKKCTRIKPDERYQNIIEILCQINYSIY